MRRRLPFASCIFSRRWYRTDQGPAEFWLVTRGSTHLCIADWRRWRTAAGDWAGDSGTPEWRVALTTGSEGETPPMPGIYHGCDIRCQPARICPHCDTHLAVARLVSQRRAILIGYCRSHPPGGDLPLITGGLGRTGLAGRESGWRDQAHIASFCLAGRA